MPIKCDKQTYNYVGEIAALSTQSMVECRFPGDIVTIIAMNATTVLLSSEVTDGEVDYRGRVLLTVVYEDAQKKVCRSERGMEFSHRADDERCTPVCTADITLKSERVTSRREGSGLYISVIGRRQHKTVFAGEHRLRYGRRACSKRGGGACDR